MKQLDKDHIKLALQTSNIELAETLIHEFALIYPYDRDLCFYKCIYFLTIEQYEQAQNIITDCLRKFPTSYECYYYQACIYQAQNMTLPALKNYEICTFLCDYFKIDSNEIRTDADTQITMLTSQLNILIDECTEKKDLKSLLDITAFFERRKTIWGKADFAPLNANNDIIGNEYYVSDTEVRYIGVYRNPVHYILNQTNNMSLIYNQGEFLKYHKHGVSSYINGNAKEYLLPIAIEKPNTIHELQNDDISYTILQRMPQQFNYYRIPNNVRINSSDKAYYGEPIALGHNPKRKKLVLSLFVDGLTQEIIQDSYLKERMPNTHRFFSSGIICSQAYSTAEWTFPSLASYETGLDTLNHMLFHNTLNSELPLDFPTLSEYFKDQGYFTSKIDGDWRSTYSCGYIRGIDQYVYQNQNLGARAEQEIINVIEHLEAFKDTDQYLWMCIGDLHDVADELDLSPAMQNNLPLKYRTFEEHSETSVKQSYSENKSETYKKMVTYIDTLLGLLYSYIENNYKDSEILISLFADHGQGYLVPSDRPFLSKERSHVALMFRGGDLKPCYTDEIISSTDYLPIMCKLAGISQSNAPINGKLPKIFGGKAEREYAITESLHPGDPYYAVAHTHNFEIFFDNPMPTDNEGRFTLENYSTYGNFKSGEPITDSELLKKYEDIFISRIAEHIIYD